MRRLGLTTKGVEVCTIYSFFYNNIVKPYFWLIADDEGFNLDLLKGEDDRFDLLYPTLEAIKKESNQQYAKDDLLKLAIRNARWRIDEHGEMVCKPKHAMKANVRGTFLSSKTYLAYKKQAWAKGLMHYDDVMVCLGDEKALDFLLQPDLLNNESHRVYYVAASRAKERLFFSIPSLSNDKRKK